jgi:hypothetical protein
MPISVERATLEAHADMLIHILTVYTLSKCIDNQRYNHTSIGIYRCLILNREVKFTRFQCVKNERLVNAFLFGMLTLRTLPQ